MGELVEIVASGIEACAVLIIVGGIIYGFIRFFSRRATQAVGAHRVPKYMIGNALLLGLEFLVAADIIRTVVLDLTVTNVAALGMLVVIRTFLSWALAAEMDGRWPWKAKTESE
jgi:uncharacterized membrane protein